MNKRIHSVATGRNGTVLEISGGWVKILWDDDVAGVGPVDYHAPFTRGIIADGEAPVARMSPASDPDPFDGPEEFRLTREDVEAMEAAAVDEMARHIDEIADYDPRLDDVGLDGPADFYGVA